jgi:hypothetical protein
MSKIDKEALEIARRVLQEKEEAENQLDEDGFDKQDPYAAARKKAEEILKRK